MAEKFTDYVIADLALADWGRKEIRIAETVTPWKDQRSRGSVEIYVRNDIYKNVLHSPDTGIAWPDGAKRR